MTAELRQLAGEVAALTGAEPPDLLDESSPTLVPRVLDAEPGALYLVGLIGGKDVGKSALVNALAGAEITARTSHGPGTETVIAYVHRDEADAAAAILEREAPGQHRLVTHAADDLRRQVLLDLPDIDSHYAAHVELTRRMLRHMLFPVWMQSVEKYADQRPRELLAQVAAGNNPANFIFCLNKADQLVAAEGEAAARELADDFAGRIARTLHLEQRPRVWLISALYPDRFDLPALRRLLGRQRSEESVAESQALASRRQEASLAAWIDAQDLRGRLQALDRLREAADEQVATRITLPLLETAVPGIQADPADRLAVVDDLMAQRVARWPIVNVFHAVLGPIMSALRRRLPLEQQAALGGASDLVHQHLQRLPSTGQGAAAALPGEAAADTSRPLALRIQTTFAQLNQSFPALGRLYADHRLHEPMPAAMAEADLRQRLASAVERQRAVLRSRFARSNVFAGFFRVLLTVGALLWFPLVQPLLEAGVQGWGELPLALVRILSAAALVKSLGFLALYYAFIWAALRYATQRKVDKLLARLATGVESDPSMSLGTQVQEWSDALLSPVRTAAERLRALVERFEQLVPDRPRPPRGPSAPLRAPAL